MISTSEISLKFKNLDMNHNCSKQKESEGLSFLMMTVTSYSTGDRNGSGDTAGVPVKEFVLVSY